MSNGLQPRSLRKTFLLLTAVSILLLIFYVRVSCGWRCLVDLLDMVDGTVYDLSIAENGTRSSTLILFWTGFFGNSLQRLLESRLPSTCSRSNSCICTSDRSRLRLASAVIFHARDTYLHFLPSKRRSPGQYWVLFNVESPISAGITDAYNSIFNLTMSYRSDSDLTTTYGHFEQVARPPVRIDIRGDLKTRKPYAYWLVSNCNAERMNYAKRLASFVQVDIFGQCTGLRPCPGGKSDCELELSSSYAFYLAFENSLCPDYVTEKFWRTLSSPGGAIPIAMGAPMSYYKAVAPPNSFIHAENFTTLRELGEYLQIVASSQESFYSYHRWRETYAAYSSLDSNLAKAVCKLCAAIQDRTLPPVAAKAKLAEWFNSGCRSGWPVA